MFSKIARSQILLNKKSVFNFSLLREEFQKVVPVQLERLKKIKTKHSNDKIGEVTVDQVIGGMRGIPALFYDLSKLDAQTGITFRGYSIPDCAEFLPKAQDGVEPLPEGILWLLLTGKFPNEHQFADISNELKQRSNLTPDVQEFIRRLPKNMHPMTQLVTTMSYLQTGSKFAKAYSEGLHKSKYWQYVYEDALDVVAKVPEVAANIYRHTYFNDAFIKPDHTLDYAANYAHMMGYNDFGIKEAIRGYLTIHCDHEGGNVSAHTCHLVGSALADPYLSYAAGMAGLAGPLHGLANQECLQFLIEQRAALGDHPTDEQIKQYVLDTLGKGKVIPGYGHAVLRNTDPRFTHQAKFAQRNIKSDPLVELVHKNYNVIPKVLDSLGKVKNPYPNVDAHSGVLLNHYGLTQYDYYTVVFAVSRSIGLMANLIWSRSFGLPIERPNSVDLKWFEQKCFK